MGAISVPPTPLLLLSVRTCLCSWCFGLPEGVSHRGVGWLVSRNPAVVIGGLLCWFWGPPCLFKSFAGIHLLW